MGSSQVIYHRRGGYRSLFWPVVLIGIGVIWLLGNLNILNAQNLVVAVRLWPLLLIVVGLDLLFGRSSATLGAAIGIGSVALFVLLMLVGPAMGLGYDLKEVTLKDTVPGGDVSAAHLSVQAVTGTVAISPLSGSNALVDYNITALGDVKSTVEGSSEKTISFKQPNEQAADGLIGWVLGNFENNGDKYVWKFGLNPDTPFDIDINNGTGAVNLDLTTLQLKTVRVNVGTGGVDMKLPGGTYTGNIDTGTGGGTVVVPASADATLTITTGTGGFTVDIPDNAAVQVQGSTGVGSISVPANLKCVSGCKDDNFVGDHGTWQTDDYANAEIKITIIYKGGTGGLTIK